MLVRVDPTVETGFNCGRDRGLDAHRPVPNRCSPPRPLEWSDAALLKVLGVRRSMLPVMQSKLLGTSSVSALAPNKGNRSREIDV